MSDAVKVLDSDYVFRGKIVSLRIDTVQIGSGEPTPREVVEHIGAVVIAAVDDQDRIVFVNQYRHPVRERLDELPAGLLDVDGEEPLAAARRELAEEASLQAEHWHVLVDVYTSPGFCDEAVRVYLARGLTSRDRPDDFVVEHEEAGMTVHRVPLSDAVDRALAGEIRNAEAVAGVLAADVARRNGWRGLRPADAEWVGRPRR